MRQDPGQQKFNQWLKDIGEGKSGEWVEIPKENVVADEAALIKFAINDEEALKDPHEMIKRLILAPHNATVDDMNEAIYRRQPGVEREYFSRNKPDKNHPLTVELNAIDPNILQQFN